MNRNQRAQFMVDAEHEAPDLELLDIDVTTEELETGEILIQSEQTHSVPEAHEIERTISSLCDETSNE